MGKTQKTTLVLIIIFLAFIFTFYQLDSNETASRLMNPNENKEEEKNEEAQKNNTAVSVPNDDKIQGEEELLDEKKEEFQPTEQIEPAQPKYYINNNYFIKPLDPENEAKVVLLTFDDAPQGNFTEKTLDILDKYNAKAIFFVNGHYVEKHPALLKEIYNRGHIIGNHTWWHHNLRDIDYETTKEEIIKLNDYIEELTGERPKYFRPPFGVLSDHAKIILKEENMQAMNWSLGSLDWEYPKPEQSDKVVSQVLKNTHNGANILMHDKEVTNLALERILLELTNNGYQFVLPTEVVLPSN